MSGVSALIVSLMQARNQRNDSKLKIQAIEIWDIYIYVYIYVCVYIYIYI